LCIINNTSLSIRLITVFCEDVDEVEEDEEDSEDEDEEESDGK
jgi:hypothetical protein